MKKTLITLAAVAAALTTLSAPAIASAQPARVVVVADQRGPGWKHNDNRASAQLSNRIATLDTRIDQGRRTGQISLREGKRLNNELNLISAQKRSYERSGRGLSISEISTLDNRLDRLQGQIRYEKTDRNNRRG
jgi:TolA-binding protein